MKYVIKQIIECYYIEQVICHKFKYTVHLSILH